MGKLSRDKGMRGEREFAELVGGRRVPLSGAQRGFENDVVVPTSIGDLRAEVKRPEKRHEHAVQLAGGRA